MPHKSFWLFRSNLKITEYYHEYKDLDTFRKNCHDFYLLMPLYYLDVGIVDEVIIWRLKPDKKDIKDIVFDVNGKKYIQKFVDDFSKCLKYPKPYITFWRGGFKEYDIVTKDHHEFFSPNSLYLGAGQRVWPQFGGKYDKILIESEKDFKEHEVPFYKAANPEIFRPLQCPKEYELCWVANNKQIRYKGQKFLIQTLSRSKYLKDLRIVHVGNEPQAVQNLGRTFKVGNINCVGAVDRPTLNQYINKSKFGIVTSNMVDGCPRVSTEIISTQVPLLIRNTTRLLPYYKLHGVVEFNDYNLETQIQEATDRYDALLSEAQVNAKRCSMEKVCKMNLEVWGIK